MVQICREEPGLLVECSSNEDGEPSKPPVSAPSKRYSSSVRFVFLGSSAAFQVALHGSNHLVGRLKGAVEATFLEIFHAFCNASIDESALRWRVFIIGVREFGTGNDHLGGEHDFAAMHRGFNDVALGYADSGAEAAGESHLSFAVNFDESSHVV